MIDSVRRLIRQLLGRHTKPTIAGRVPISGSFPPLDQYAAVGSRAQYFIHDGYQVQVKPTAYQDTECRDEWQDEVYRYAREIADANGLLRIVDIGCGSGYKLLKHFGDRDTCGMDLPDTVAWLKQRYPDRRWELSRFEMPLPRISCDLVLCSDVIEHVPDPDALLGLIDHLAPSLIVISTPDRNLLRAGTHDGPPANPAHIREWNMTEFRAYIADRFDVLEHFVSDGGQCTQCMLARPRKRT